MSAAMIKSETMHVRWMIRRDMAEVLEIEHLCFQYPWNEATFIDELKQRNCIGMVAELVDPKQPGGYGPVVGFVIYRLMAKHLVIDNLAVAPFAQGRGVGRKLVEKVKSKLSLQRRRKASAVVSDRNLDGQLFFRAMGFRAVGVLHDHFENPSADGYAFVFALQKSINKEVIEC